MQQQRQSAFPQGFSVFRICVRLSDAGNLLGSQRLLRILTDDYAVGDYRLEASDRYIAGQPVMPGHRIPGSNIVWREGDAIPVGLTHRDHIACILPGERIQARCNVTFRRS